jgi:hypothetical protein
LIDRSGIYGIQKDRKEKIKEKKKRKKDKSILQG